MKKPKSVEEWRARGKKSPGFRLLTREILFSQAFSGLSGSAVKLLLLAWDQVMFEPNNTRNKRDRKRNLGGVMKNDIIVVPHNGAKAVGVTSSATITKARKELIANGFLDVEETGSVHAATRFKISERWRKYPDVKCAPDDHRPAGKSLYAKSTLKNPAHPILKRKKRGRLEVVSGGNG